MGLQEEIEKHIEKPRLRELEIEAEYLDSAVKLFDEIITLADEDRMSSFLDVIKRKKERAERILLDSKTSDAIKRECIGEMRALSDVYNWKQYYLNAIKQAKSDLKAIKKELETGERPEEQPND